MQAMYVFRLVLAITVPLTTMASPSQQRIARANRKSTAAAKRVPARTPKHARLSTSASKVAGRVAATGCEPCSAAVATVSTRTSGRASSRVAGRAVKKAVRPCHAPDYVDPRVRADLNAALRDLKRAGISPKITSAWRSSGDQGWMYRCTSSRRCRLSHPGLFRAMPPGQSAHEAGLALDISGIAAGPRGANHLTPQGRRIVPIMEKHGFNWKYGLADPVHFEADPRDYGYRDLKQAIHVTQTRCQAGVLARAAGRTRGLEKRPAERRMVVVKTAARGSRTQLRRKA